MELSGASTNHSSTTTEKLNNSSSTITSTVHHPTTNINNSGSNNKPNSFSSLESNLYHLRNLFHVNQSRFDPYLVNEINTLLNNLATDAAVLSNSNNNSTNTNNNNSSTGRGNSGINNSANHPYHHRHRNTRVNGTSSSSSSGSTSSTSSPSSPSSTNAHPPPSTSNNNNLLSSSSNLLSNKDNASHYRSLHHYNNSDDAASTKAIQGGRQPSRRRGRYTVSFSMNNSNNNDNNSSNSNSGNNGNSSITNRYSKYPPIVPPVQEQEEDQECNSDTAVVDEQDQSRLMSRNHLINSKTNRGKVTVSVPKTVPLSDDADSNSHEDDDDDDNNNDSEDYDAAESNPNKSNRISSIHHTGSILLPSLKGSKLLPNNRISNISSIHPNNSISPSTNPSTVQGNAVVLRRVQEQEDVGDTDVPGTWADRSQQGTTEAWTPAMVAGHLANLLDRPSSYRPYQMNMISGVSSSSSAITADSSSISHNNPYDQANGIINHTRKFIGSASNQAIEGTIEDRSNSENDDDVQVDDASRAVAMEHGTHRLSTGSISDQNDSDSTMSVEHDEEVGDEDQNSYADPTVSKRYSYALNNKRIYTSVNNITVNENGVPVFHSGSGVGSIGEQGRLSVVSRNSQSARGSVSYNIPSMFIPNSTKAIRNEAVDDILSTSSNPFVGADDYIERANGLQNGGQDMIEGRGSAAAERGSDRSENEDNVSVTHSEDNPIIPHLRDDSETDSIDINTTVEQSAVEYAFDRDYGDADLRPPVQRISTNNLRSSPTKKSTMSNHSPPGYSTTGTRTTNKDPYAPVDTRLPRTMVSSKNTSGMHNSTNSSPYPVPSSLVHKYNDASSRRQDNGFGKTNVSTVTNSNYVLQSAWRRANIAGDIWQNTTTTSVPSPNRNSNVNHDTSSGQPHFANQNKSISVRPPSLPPSNNNSYNRSTDISGTLRNEYTETRSITSSSDDDSDKYMTYQAGSYQYDTYGRNIGTNGLPPPRKQPLLARPGSAKPRRTLVTGGNNVNTFTEENMDTTFLNRNHAKGNGDYNGKVRNNTQGLNPTRATPNPPVPGYVARAGSAGLLSDNHHHHHHYHHSNNSNTVYPSQSLEDNYSSSSRNPNASGHNLSSELNHGRSHSHRPVWSASSAVRRGTVMASTMDLDAVEAAADINFGARVNKLATRRSSDGGGAPTILHNV